MMLLKKMIGLGHSASWIARILANMKVTGKRGGKWNSSSVLRTTRNKFHSTRNEDEAPKWFKNQKTLKLKV